MDEKPLKNEITCSFSELEKTRGVRRDENWGRVNLENIACEHLEIRGLFSVYLFSHFSCFHLLLVWGIWAHRMLWTFYETKIKFVHLSTIEVNCRFSLGAIWYLIWWVAVDSCLWVRWWVLNLVVYDGFKLWLSFSFTAWKVCHLNDALISLCQLWNYYIESCPHFDKWLVVLWGGKSGSLLQSFDLKVFDLNVKSRFAHCSLHDDNKSYAFLMFWNVLFLKGA